MLACGLALGIPVAFSMWVCLQLSQHRSSVRDGAYDMNERHSCFDCAHLHREIECWEMPEIWWWECARCTGMANLRSFPFTSTKCRFFKESQRSIDVDVLLKAKTA